MRTVPPCVRTHLIEPLKGAVCDSEKVPSTASHGSIRRQQSRSRQLPRHRACPVRCQERSDRLLSHATRILQEGDGAAQREGFELVDEQAQTERRTEAGAGHPCPVCASRNVAEIVYGYPAFDQEWEAKLGAGEWAIGGCVIEPDQADY